MDEFNLLECVKTLCTKNLVETRDALLKMIDHETSEIKAQKYEFALWLIEHQLATQNDIFKKLMSDIKPAEKKTTLVAKYKPLSFDQELCMRLKWFENQLSCMDTQVCNYFKKLFDKYLK